MSYTKWRSQPYQPGQKEVYKVSRSKIELFMQCPRCFWLDARLKIGRPSSPPFQINKAIDELLKKEFDVYRKKGKPHPMLIENSIQAIPFDHDQMDTWRMNFTGVATLHEPTNLHVFGAVDDIWVNDDGELIVVDYKATAKNKEIIDLEPKGTWHDMYRRQMEIYQWLLRQNGFKVSDTGYFVYANGIIDNDGFYNKVEFRTNVFPHHGQADWVDGILVEMKDCLDGDIPAVGTAAMGGPCEFCAYAKQRTELTITALQSKTTKKQNR